MASHRPYREALGMERALGEISKGKGMSYDPEVVDALFRLKTPEIEKIWGRDGYASQPAPGFLGSEKPMTAKPIVEFQAI